MFKKLKEINKKITLVPDYPPDEVFEGLAVEKIEQGWQKTVKLIKAKKAPYKLGLYVHIPFCENKCQFCYCPSIAKYRSADIGKYIAVLKKEMQFYKKTFKNMKFNTVNIGGGTPSILSGKHIKELFTLLKDNFSLGKKCQITFETSPTSIDQRKLKILRNNGVGRITLGIQSMSKEALKRAGRRQSFENVRSAMLMIRQAGFKHINAEFIAGLEGETMESFLAGVTKVIHWGATIVHTYPFLPNESTLFRKKGKKVSEKQNELKFRMVEEARKVLFAHGFKSVEYEAPVRTGADANEQLLDERVACGSILGLGLSARSYAFASMAYRNSKDISQYYQDSFPKEGIIINIDEQMRKYAIINSRVRLELSDYKKIFGVSFTRKFKKELNMLKKAGKVERAGDTLLFKYSSYKEHLLYSKLFFSEDFIEKILANN